MFRLAASQLSRRAKISPRTFPAIAATHGFHATGRREETTKEVSPPAPSGGLFDSFYAAPVGIALAIPALYYEWYLINEETQLALCFLVNVMLMYKNLGGTIAQTLEQDGKQILAEHNEIDDAVINVLEESRVSIEMQDRIVEDAKDIFALQVETYEKLNEIAQLKPQHQLKAQIERALTIIQSEESNILEKAKVKLMEEATVAVTNKLRTDKKLQKISLDSAISQLTGKAGGVDIVKDGYLSFFKAKKSSKIDEDAEIKAARENIIGRLNAIASTEGFFFRFDANGNPQITV